VSGNVLEPNTAFSETKIGSDRKFGLTMFAACMLFGAYPLVHGGPLRLWLVVPGVAFFIVAVAHPVLLAPLNRLWMRFGHLLSRVTNPIVMAVLFFGGVWPIGGLMRLCGARPLGLDFDRRRNSYWHARKPRDPHTSLRRQF